VRGKNLIAACLLSVAACHSTPSVPSVEHARLPVVDDVTVIADSYAPTSGIEGHDDGNWPQLMLHQLVGDGFLISPAVGAEAGSGYVARGTDGRAFGEKLEGGVPNDARLVVFVGSRNDADIPPEQLAAAVARDYAMVHTIAPASQILVIGPAWPDATPPPDIVGVRDVLKREAQAAGATFVDPLALGWFVGQADLLSSDGNTLSAAGHQYLANMVAPLVESALCAPHEFKASEAPPEPPPAACARLN
jgi:lysophospholipase L1-like esterase